MIVLSLGHCLCLVLILSVCFDVDALNKLEMSSVWILLVWLSSKRSNQTPPQPFWQRSTLKPRRSTSLSFDSQAGQCIVGIDLDSLISLWQASCHMSVFCFQFTWLAWQPVVIDSKWDPICCEHYFTIIRPIYRLTIFYSSSSICKLFAGYVTVFAANLGLDDEIFLLYSRILVKSIDG